KGEGEREGDEDEKNHKDEDGKMKREEIRHEEDEKQRGEQGTEGPQGPEGPVGPIGPQGPKGEDGTMTFEDLTPEQVENLRGEQGPEGPQGPQGPQVEQGADGGLLNTNLNLIPYNESFWESGAICLQGPKGEDSTMTFEDITPEQVENLRGEQGPEGPQGPQGPQGEQGADGGLLNTNLNLIPYNESFWETGAITVSNGENSVNDTAIRTKEAIKISQGETYTFHDKSTYLSAINR